MAEEKKKKEERLMKEYQRQLREELEVEEMQKLHEKATGKKKKQRLDWMYESAGANKQTNPDEYLMGKAFKMGDKNDDMDVIKGKVPGSNWVNRPKASEEFQVLQNDPMVRMKAAKDRRMQQILTNPMLMKLIQEDVDKGSAIKAKKKLLKKLKKQAKKLKKKQKKAARRKEEGRKHSSKRS